MVDVLTCVEDLACPAVFLALFFDFGIIEMVPFVVLRNYDADLERFAFRRGGRFRLASSAAVAAGRRGLFGRCGVFAVQAKLLRP